MKIQPHYLHCNESPVDVLFFGESPNREDQKQGIAFTGTSGEMLRTLIDHELSGQKVCLDNVYPSDALGEAKPKKDDLLEYVEHVKDRVTTCKPKVIVALGKTALIGLGCSETNVTKLCGRIIPSDLFKKARIIASIHPAYALHDSKQLDRFRGVFAAVRLQLRGRKRKQTTHKITRVDDPSGWRGVLTCCAKRLTSFDIETSDLNPLKGRLLTVALSFEIGSKLHTFWTPLFHKEFDDASAPAKLEDTLFWWSKGPRICHNAKFELRWMRANGAFDDPPKLYDTMLQAWLLDENEPKGLDHLAVKYLKASPWWLDLPNSNLYADADLESLGTYNAYDAIYTLKLHHLQRKRMETPLIQLADNLLHPLVKVLARMEERGLYCGEEALAKVSRRMRGIRTKLLNRIHAQWPGLNVRSPKQVAKLCFTDLGLSPIRYTDGGASKKKAPSTDADVLEALSKIEPRLTPLAELRVAESLLSRVLEPWAREHIDEKNFIHTNYGTTVTGRLSSYNPNLQNLDRRGDGFPWKGCQRDALISRFPKGRILQADYSQHELRNYAGIAGDKFFLGIFRDPKADIHTETAKELGVIRTIAKNVNFSILYVITPEGLLGKYGIAFDVGRSTITAWHLKHPWLKQFYRKACEDLLRQGYVENIFGWRRRLENPVRSKAEIRRFLETLDNPDFYYTCTHELRQMFNFLIQGPAAVITNFALLGVEKKLNMKKYQGAVLVHQIHDSVVVDAPKKTAKSVAKLMVKVMETLDLSLHTKGRLHNRIPLKAEVKMGECL